MGKGQSRQADNDVFAVSYMLLTGMEVIMVVTRWDFEALCLSVHVEEWG
jgi:hypothetical protein